MSDTNMDTDRFDALMRLAEFRNTRIADRRSHEWKVTVALWALLAAGIIELRIPRSTPALAIFAIVLFGVVVAHAFLWVGDHWRQSKKDILISFFYTDRAQDHVLLPAENILAVRGQAQQAWPRNIACCEFLCQGRCWAQILTTFFLAAGLWLASACGLATH